MWWGWWLSQETEQVYNAIWQPNSHTHPTLWMGIRKCLESILHSQHKKSISTPIFFVSSNNHICLGNNHSGDSTIPCCFKLIRDLGKKQQEFIEIPQINYVRSKWLYSRCLWLKMVAGIYFCEERGWWIKSVISTSSWTFSIVVISEKARCIVNIVDRCYLQSWYYNTYWKD